MNKFIAYKNKLRNVFIDSEKTELNYINELLDNSFFKTRLHYFLSLVSTFIICIGFNFDSNSTILFGMIFNPILVYVLKISLGFSAFDSKTTFNGIKKLFIHILLILFISIVYFWISPVYTNPKFILEHSNLNLSYFFIAYILGLLAILILKFKSSSVLFYLLGLSIFWTPSIVCLGYAFVQFDILLIQKSFQYFGICLFNIFLGSFLFFKFIKIPTNLIENKLSSIGLKLALFTILLIGIYFSFKTVIELINTRNIESYLFQAINSKTCTINSYEKDGLKNEINVYYNGIKSPNTQDELLKKKFKVTKYNFNYQSI